MKFEKIAVLFDADNVNADRAESALKEMGRRGRVVVKRAYKNWNSPSKSWDLAFQRLAIEPRVQREIVQGKNAADHLLGLEALELRMERNVDCFAIVSSDSDFTVVAVKLIERGTYVVGFGEKKAPEAFRNACDEFILLDGSLQKKKKKAKNAPPKKQNAENKDLEIETNVQKTNVEPSPTVRRMRELLNETYFDAPKDAGGFVNAGLAGARIKTEWPDFRYQTLKFKNLSAALTAFRDGFQTKNVGKATYYKPLK